MESVREFKGDDVPLFLMRRAVLIVGALAFVFAVTIFVGVRFGLLLAVGLGFGIALEGLRFGFAGPWRAMILRRDPAGIWAQLLSIGIVTMVALPLIAANPGELTAAQAPIGFAMIGGAFVFGIAMQVVLGCGSGTLVNAGSGNPIGLLALPFFALGSFAGAFHLFWWTDLGAVYIPNFSGIGGAIITIMLLLFAAAVFWWFAAPENRYVTRRHVVAAVMLALLAILNLVIAGQPWGVVYGLGLWVAKAATAMDASLSSSIFWSAPASVERIQSSVLTDYTSLTNFGIIAGAFIVAHWRFADLSQRFSKLPLKAWVSTIIAGFLLGYSSRLAFGCNVGAFFSGISTGSLHGWVWFVAAFAGSFFGVRLRDHLGFVSRS
ncbi:MAG: YeeE/YedE family protein [Pseudomonadota bacterium]